MSLSDLRMVIEISPQLTIMQFVFKSHVYRTAKAWKTCSLRCTRSGTDGSLTGFKPTRKHLQLSTDNKKVICCYKTLSFSDGTSFERSKKPSYWCAQGGIYGKWFHASFGCSRQTIHNLVNRYSITGSVTARARPDHKHVTTLRPYHVNTLTHPRNCFYINNYCLAFTGFMHKRSLIISCKITQLAFSSMTM